MDVTDVEIAPGVELISIPNSSNPRTWWFLLRIPQESGIYRTQAAARADFAAGTVKWQEIS